VGVALLCAGGQAGMWCKGTKHKQINKPKHKKQTRSKKIDNKKQESGNLRKFLSRFAERTNDSHTYHLWGKSRVHLRKLTQVRHFAVSTHLFCACEAPDDV